MCFTILAKHPVDYIRRGRHGFALYAITIFVGPCYQLLGCGTIFNFPMAMRNACACSTRSIAGSTAKIRRVPRSPLTPSCTIRLPPGGFGQGGVFAVNPSGTSRTIYRFKGIRDGSHPSAGLIGANGALHGTSLLVAQKALGRSSNLAPADSNEWYTVSKMGRTTPRLMRHQLPCAARSTGRPK